MYENQRESEAIRNNILERMEVSEIYTDFQCSEEDEENLGFYHINIWHFW